MCDVERNGGIPNLGLHCIVGGGVEDGLRLVEVEVRLKVVAPISLDRTRPSAARLGVAEDELHSSPTIFVPQTPLQQNLSSFQVSSLMHGLE